MGACSLTARQLTEVPKPGSQAFSDLHCYKSEPCPLQGDSVHLRLNIMKEHKEASSSLIMREPE